MNIKTTIRTISPFNNDQEMSPVLYAVKKMLAFVLIYLAAAGLLEAIVIVALSVTGYDFLNGVIPPDHIFALITYYGFAGFGLATILYSKIFEKRSLRDLGFSRRVFDYLTGAILAIVLLVVIVGACLYTGLLRFDGMVENPKISYLVLLLGGFIVQSLSEEILTRGFLLGSLSKKIPLPLAIFVSSTAFTLPHLASVLAAGGAFAVIGVVNLYLVSLVFSLLFLLRSNIYIVSGLHFAWNFILSTMGLAVSGGEPQTYAPLMIFDVTSQSILTGGAYGLEAGLITTAVFGVAAAILILVKLYRKEAK